MNLKASLISYWGLIFTVAFIEGLAAPASAQDRGGAELHTGQSDHGVQADPLRNHSVMDAEGRIGGLDIDGTLTLPDYVGSPDYDADMTAALVLIDVNRGRLSKEQLLAAAERLERFAPISGKVRALQEMARAVRRQGTMEKAQAMAAFLMPTIIEEAAPYPVPLRDGSLSRYDEGSGLLPAPKAGSVASPFEVPGTEAFVGTWRKVHGDAAGDLPEVLKVTKLWNGVQVDYGHNSATNFDDIGFVVGSSPEPGRLIDLGWRTYYATDTRLDGRKLDRTETRSITHFVRIPNQLEKRESLELTPDGRHLVVKKQSVLYRRRYFYSGPFDTETTLDTTDVQPSAQPKRTAVYVRDDSAY